MSLDTPYEFNRCKYRIRFRKDISRTDVVFRLCDVIMMSVTLYHCFRLVFGTLYPAYKSYKAVKTKNVKEYVSSFAEFEAATKHISSCAFHFCN